MSSVAPFQETLSQTKDTYGSMENSNHQDEESGVPEKSHISIGYNSNGNHVESDDNNSQDEHLGKHRQYWRDIILGVNDGLVSTFLLVSGVAGGGLSSTQILLTAISGALAGAVSMCAGEYVATKSQNEVIRGEIALERKHIQQNRRDELSEVSSLLELIGISNEDDLLREQLMTFYEENPEALLKLMTALEFGVIDEEERSPIWAAITSGLLFIVGSLPSVIPFIFNVRPTYGLIYAAVITVFSLMVVGMVKTWATRGNCVSAAVENLLIAGLGGGIAYGVGLLFDAIVNP